MKDIEIASKFAQLGYHVFPLYAGKNGQKNKPFGWALNEVTPEKASKAIPATTDIDVISQWPSMVKSKYKSTVAGFGILGVGCLILDLDVKNGKNGILDFKTILDKYKLPKPTMVTITKSGGLHLFYQRPTKYQNTPIKTLAGIQIDDTKYPSIDLRGDGGFVVGPNVLIDNLDLVPPGSYGTKGLRPLNELPEFPAKLMSGWIKTHADLDLENITVINEDMDFKAVLRRGHIPEYVPKGARNEAFYTLIRALKDKNNPIESIRYMCGLLAKRVGEPETLSESVNIEAMISRAFEEVPNSPNEVAADLLNRGLFQLTGYKGKLHYVILEDNPYIGSRNPHDEASMKTLLMRYQKTIESPTTGKPIQLNPISCIIKQVNEGNRVDLLGFKPNAGEVFSLHDEPGSKKFLNTFRPLTVNHAIEDLDEGIWDEFMFLISRLFGPIGSEDCQLGMDFLAWLIQYPEIKPGMAPFIMSVNRGVGKSLLFNVLIAIMGTAKDGERQARLVKLDEITGRFFNPSGCIINLIDEVQFPVHKNTRQESTSFWRHLKNLITAETVSVEIKGGATYQSPNSAAIALAGNFGSYFPVEEFDRRLWIIDANPPILELGTVDKLFDLVRRAPLEVEDRNRYISTLRYKLKTHKIKHDMGSIRAPMTVTKQEMYENSLTDTEEWFVTHFRDTGNLFAYSPIVSASAMEYTWDQCGRSAHKDTQTFLRDLKRKGHIRPIRLRKDLSTSKQFSVPIVNMDGTLVKTDRREVLYTIRDHGMYDEVEVSKILELFNQNCATIGRHKNYLANQRFSKVTAESLLGR